MKPQKNPLIASPEESIKNLDAAREVILAKRDRLDMSNWHDGDEWKKKKPEEEIACGTTHCLAGWLQVLSTNPEIRDMRPVEAGFVSAPRACGMFYQPAARVFEWLENREYAREAVQA